MSYVVFARKYRPQQFKDLIGQEHITDILSQAIEQNKTAHGYLFCGPRGVGKTSCARILAKALNCEKGPVIQPCGECSNCKQISQGSSFDVLEIDGASNRGIDEIRVLRENIKFAPNAGKFKIYIVDEVHMLTTEAFNALLKTLEEPPEHVKFLFATTEVQKVPATILSRCQRFDFKLISSAKITAQIDLISKKEKFTIDEEAKYAVAKAAKGSMRDALSILDQLSAISQRDINSEDVHNMLGLVETEYLFQLSDDIAQLDCSSALDHLEQIIQQGKDLKQLLKDLLLHFRHLMIVKIGGKSLSKLVDYTANYKEQLLEQTESYTLSKILHCIDTFIETQDISRITESLRTPIEVALAKLTYSESDIQKVTSTPKQPTVKNVTQTTKNSAPMNDPASHEEDKNEKKKTSLKSSDTSVQKFQDKWDLLTGAVSKIKMSTATLLQDGFPQILKDGQLTIGFDKALRFNKETLESKENLDLVSKVFSQVTKQDLRIRYVLLTGEEKPVEKKMDDTVSETVDEFGGTVVSQWHNDS